MTIFPYEQEQIMPASLTSCYKDFAKKSILLTGATLGASFGACVALWIATDGANACKVQQITTSTPLHSHNTNISTLVALSVAILIGRKSGIAPEMAAKCVEQWVVTSTVAGGLAGYKAADQIAKAILG